MAIDKPTDYEGEAIEQEGPRSTRTEYPQSYDEQMKLEARLRADGFEAKWTASGREKGSYENQDNKIVEAQKAGKKTVLVHLPNVTGSILWIEK